MSGGWCWDEPWLLLSQFNDENPAASVELFSTGRRSYLRGVGVVIGERWPQRSQALAVRVFGGQCFG